MLCEKVAIIDQGKILQEGSPKALTQELGQGGITVQLNKDAVILEKDLSGFTYNVEDNRIHFVVKDPDSSLPEIIQKLSQMELHIQNITTNASSLEDVFLSLTGKSINE